MRGFDFVSAPMFDVLELLVASPGGIRGLQRVIKRTGMDANAAYAILRRLGNTNGLSASFAHRLADRRLSDIGC